MVADEMRNIKREAEFAAVWQPLLSCPFKDGSCLAQGRGAQNPVTLGSTFLFPPRPVPRNLCSAIFPSSLSLINTPNCWTKMKLGE